MELSIKDLKPQEIVIPEINVIVITDKSGLEKMQEAKKNLVKIRTDYTKNFSPVKQAIDGLKKQALDYEKEQIKKIEAIETEVEKSISAWNQEQYRIQQELKRKAEEEARKKAEEIRQIELAKQEEIRKQKEAELAELAKKPIAETIDKIEEIKSQIESAPIIPEIEIQPEKVVLKKDEIKAEEIFLIENESAFIEWAILNNRSLIKIEIRTAETKKWLSKKENQDKQKFQFLRSELKIK